MTGAKGNDCASDAAAIKRLPGAISASGPAASASVAVHGAVRDSSSNSLGNGIGAALPRSEDLRLVRGNGCYASDVLPDNALHAFVLRAPHAHARILHINASDAVRRPGVHIVLTGADARADHLRPIPHKPDWQGPPDAVLRVPDGFEVFETTNDVLSDSIVRYVGEPVAVVIADTRAQAADAAEYIDVDYEVLQAATTAAAAMQEDAPQFWPACPQNLALTCEVGDADATAAAFARAAHTVALKSWIHRVTGSPMEPRSVLAEYDAENDRYTLRTASGRGVVQTRERLAATLGIEPERCRVVFGDMGGNFGTRNAFFPEYTLMPWASAKVGRPIRWTADRSECFLSDYQARDITIEAELALDEHGRFLAMRGTNVLNLGAYTVYFWPLRKGLSMMQGVYDVPVMHFRGHAVLTNTMPTAVYRSAGRPEAIYMVERLIEQAARETGLDRAEIRRINLIPSEAMPFTNAVGVTYDSGDYADGMSKALATSRWDSFDERREASLADGKCRGIAVANYIEVTSGIPRECVELHVTDDGTIEMVVGTMSSGQGHETSFPQLIADWLDVPHAQIRYVVNDTDRVSVGGGSHSGRSMRLASIAAGEAVEELLERGKAVAAQLLQTPADEVTYANGHFHGRGTASATLAEVTRASRAGEAATHLMGIGDITNRVGGYPYGSHVCEVEVDPDTGHVDIVDWTCVDDVGLAVNPLILHGQAHGATTQGIGQALMEAIHYDADSAQLLTGSFMDYAMPRADVTPPFRTVITEVPAASHPYGIRPGGEGGTTPALAALVNAVLDALKDYGVEDIGMPLTPERVWRAIQDGKSKRL